MKSSVSKREQRRLNGAKLILLPLSSELASLAAPFWTVKKLPAGSLLLSGTFVRHTPGLKFKGEFSLTPLVISVGPHHHHHQELL